MNNNDWTMFSSPAFWVAAFLVSLPLSIIGNWISSPIKDIFLKRFKSFKESKEKEKKIITEEGINLLTQPQKALMLKIDILSKKIFFLYYLLFIILFFQISPKSSSSLFLLFVLVIFAFLFASLFETAIKNRTQKVVDFYDKNIELFEKIKSEIEKRMNEAEEEKEKTEKKIDWRADLTNEK